MKTLASSKTEAVFQQLIGEIKSLASNFRKNCEAIAVKIKAALEIDRERAFSELRRVFPRTMILGFEQVARGKPVKVFLNGSEATQVVDTLSISDQRRISEGTSYCVVGGVPNKPEWRHVSFEEMTRRSAEAFIDTQRGVIRKNRKDIVAAYFKRNVRRSKDAYEFSSDLQKITLHRRTWKVAELKAILNGAGKC